MTTSPAEPPEPPESTLAAVLAEFDRRFPNFETDMRASILAATPTSPAEPPALANPCLNCGTDAGGGVPSNPLHCGHCPPWKCEDCGETCSSHQLCPCWTSVDDLSFADLKAVFARSDLSLDPEKP